jgi:putative addiction module antidote
MNFKLKLTALGNSSGIILPEEVLRKFGVTEGESVFLSELSDGFHLTGYDPELEEQMEKARRVMRDRRDVLRKLAE